MISTDTFIEIGNSHKICEDYIISGNIPIPYIILSDGCSSSNDTEMGARILCHLAKQYLLYREDDLYNLDHKNMGNWIIHNAEMAARQLGLKLSCLDATLIVSFQLDNKIHIYIYGDGTIAKKDSTGIQFTTIEYTKNAPYYLSYLVDDYRRDLYHKVGNEIILATNGPSEIDSFCVAYDYPTKFTYNVRDFETLFISSDGMLSFIIEDPSQNQKINPSIILSDFMAFKNTKGEFLKRRVSKAVKKLNREGIVHFDDLSIGAYYRSQEENS